MKILLDEGVPEIIQQRLLTFSIFTVEQMGSRSLKNGDLLARMMGEFQIIITTDKNLPFQQNLKKRQIRDYPADKRNSSSNQPTTTAQNSNCYNRAGRFQRIENDLRNV